MERPIPFNIYASSQQMTKRCTKCGEEKNIDQYHSNKTCKNGLLPYCISCQRKFNNEYRANHNDIINKQQMSRYYKLKD